MNRIPTTRLIVQREVGERLHSRFTWAMAALTALFVVAIIVVPAVLRQPTQPTVVGLVGPSAEALAPALRTTAKAARVAIRIVDVRGSTEARSEVAKGSLDVALSLGPDSARAEVKRTLSPTMAALLQATVDQAHQKRALSEARIPLSKVLPALQPVPFSTRTLDRVTADQAARDVAAIAAGLLLYVSLALYSGAVASGVAQEKTSRTAEVLLGAVRPSQLMNGKVLGIGACRLGQLGIAAVAGLIANAAAREAVIPSTIWLLLPAILLWFVLGFALYAFACAAAGAMVARQEEVQAVTMPLLMPLIVGFLLTYAVAFSSPNTLWLQVLSFLPPLAPMLMPARLAIGQVAAWQMPAAVLIMVVSIYGTARLAARIYASSLVRGGARLSWRAALRLGGE
ncbi:MAG: ABC transporter permease [Candidatus Dormibacteria bacterium]|jgi:ABC-2 type transport system permease protein